MIGRLFSGVHQLAERWYTVSAATSSTMAGTTCTPLDDVPTTATRLPATSTPSAGQRPGVVLHAAEVVAPGDVGHVRHRQHAGGAHEEPDRVTVTPAVPSSVVTVQVPDASSDTAEVTVAPKRMWRRRSKRSTTWFR